ncbi:DNA methyltransferase 1-associated protein 1 [Blastomyces dermatitidis ER-3]|uniref:SWR1-complex protein 4 n=1 Tax=Ajellomyces dermatitidis (strain ER-3 / ATCC MYA-2586) TaxID=559297 RepID=A0ABP2EV43_AJEDR|nr:DNA methyltransferase 1-associated protein 1 [Blastomyces dermatitidis ER-3]EEQ87819.2 DNA methyltransferase 1-associated protein 1 [Blastomyces dermatitidis ER-3]
MAAADIRDMLDLPADGGQPRPHKKQKVVEKRPEGITRELFALLGERAPPIALNENKYKGRRKWVSKLKVRPWEMAPFENSARSDGLVLRHWQRKRAVVNEATPVETAGAGDGEVKNETEAAENKLEDVYAFAKYNVKAQVPKRYTDDQYNRYLKSHIWSREETDYLMDLVEEYDLRWIVIADRYEYPPSPPSTNGESTALVTTTRRRTMEEMKSRYYTIAANMLALEHPPSEMSEAEFNLHEKMMKYDPEQEKARKDLATLQLNRSKDEVNEETLLLEELKRIVANEKNFIEERRELYARLEAPISTSNTTMYQSSQGLSQLLHTLLQADKSKKRRSLMALETGTSSPASQPSTQQNPPQSARESRPQTPAAPAPTPATTKKAASAAAQQPNVKSLTPAEEAKYGVTRHERLTSGVQFRNDRAQKLTQAKSNIQSQKLAAALTELSIPPRLVMPTEKVCKEFEKLIHSVNLLLDVRKFAEKVEGEIRVLEAAKHERERKEKERLEAEEASKTGGDTAGAGQGNEGDKEADKEKQGAAGGDEGVGEDKKAVAAAADTAAINGADAPATKRHDEASAIKSEADDESKEAGAEGAATAGSGRTHKRSASVLSAVSDKSTKRQKK